MRQRAILGNRAAFRAVVLTLALLAVASGLCVAQGTAFRYTTDRQILKTCVLQIPDPAAPGTYYPTSSPMVFAVLDQLPQKPGDWQLDNPLAPPAAVRDTPAYWVVPLNAGSAERLAEFDVILISTGVPTDFATPVFPFPPAVAKQSTNDLLRKIADNGVTLWFEGGSGMLPVAARPFSIPFGFGAGATFPKVIADPRNSLMTSPFALSTSPVSFLGTPAAQTLEIAGFAPALQAVVTDGLVPPRAAVAAGSWGGGRVVVSSCDVAGAIDAIGLAAPVPPAELADVLFAYNVLAWHGDWGLGRQSPRNAATVTAVALPPLGIKWQYPGPMDDPAVRAIGPAVSTPVVARGMVFYAARAVGGLTFTPGTLLAFDATPKTDLDGDGRPDDGIPDLSIGEPYDLVWMAPLPGDPMCGSPTAVTADAALVGGPPGLPGEIVVVTSADQANAYVQAFNAAHGALLWTFTQAARLAPATIAISAPVVRDGWVFFTTTEGTPGVPLNPTTGSAYCIDLASGGTGLRWAYPDPAFGEASTLPPFATISASRDTVRVISSPAVYSKEIDRFGRPAVTDAIMRLAGGAGPGMDVEVVPIPTLNYAAFGSGALNDGNGVTVAPWFSVALPATFTSIDAVLQDDSATPFTLGTDYAINLPLGCITFSQQAARSYIAAGPSPTGRDVVIQYTDVTAKTITRRLAGVVQSTRARPTWERWVSPVIGEHAVFAGANAAPPAPGRLYALSQADSNEQWAFDPRTALFPSAMATNPQSIHRAPPAADPDTVYLPTSFDLDPADAITAPDGAALTALETNPSFDVQLVGGPNRVVDTVDPARLLQVQTIEGPGGVPGRLNATLPADQASIIAPTFYAFDATSRTLRFSRQGVDSVSALDGSPLGAIYGRPVWVSYYDDSGTPANPADDTPRLEMHVLPTMLRWQYVPFTAQLAHYPIVNPGGGYAAPADLAITLVRDGTPIPPADYTVSPRLGKVLFVPGSLAVGQQVDIAYRFQPAGPLTGAAVPVLPLERHEIAAPFRLSESAPAVSGSTIHVGLESPPPPEPQPERPLLSLLWNKASNLITSWRTSVADVPVGYPAGLLPVVGSPVAVTEDSVYVGSSLSDGLPYELADGTPTTHGFITALRSERTLIADANRILETNGPRLAWVCTGTQLVDPLVPTTVEIRPFVRPSKVTKLSSGALLVADTGNNRVVEVDRQGNLVWPLTTVGDEADFGLREPGDAYRYLGDGPGGPGAHTVIADTGNGRIVDILTTLDAAGAQVHALTVVTPEFLPSLTGGKPLRIAYSHAQPVFANPGAAATDRACTTEPATGATLVGYLASALNVEQLMVVNADRTGWPNVIDPVGPVGGMAGVGWKWCDWLYDMNQDGVANDPVRFRNVRFAEITQFGPWMYLTVVCSSWGDGVVFSPNGPGVYQFQVQAAGAPGTRGLSPGNQTSIATGGVPFWEFGQANYLFEDAPANTVRRATSWLDIIASIPKRWQPVCAKILPNGDRLITNNAALVPNATRANLPPGAATDNSEVLQVHNAPGFPIDPDRMVPSPNWPEWPDPFSQPVYAEVN